MEILSFVGSPRRNRPSRKHGSLYGEQLLASRFLEKLASQLQSMDCSVSGLASVMYVFSYTRQIHLYPSWWYEELDLEHCPDLLIRGLMARPFFHPVDVGLARQSIYPT